MASNDRRIDWSYFLDVRNFVKGNQQAEKSMGKTQKSTMSLNKAFGALGLALGGREVVRWVSGAVQLAAAAEEVDSKFEAVFGSAEQLNRELEEWGDMAGVTTTQAKNMAATFGNLAMAQGIGADETQVLTKLTAELAGDLASFNDEDPGRAFDALNKALLTTEREGLKAFGIAISEADVKTRAAARAAEQGRTEVTKADRAYASYAIAIEQAGQASGDLERTQDSAANTQRRLSATVEELQEEIGRELLPVYADLLELAEDSIPILQAVAKATGNVIDPFGETARSIEETNKALEESERELNIAERAWNFFARAVAENSHQQMAWEEANRRAADSAEMLKETLDQTDLARPYRLMQLAISDAAAAHSSLNQQAREFDPSKIIAAEREYAELRALLSGQDIADALEIWNRTNPGNNLFG